VLVATSDHLVDPLAYGLQIGVIVVSTIAIALYWAVRRPGNRIGPVLLAYAACAAGLSLQGASSPLLHSVGVLFDAPMFLLGFYLVFIFPQGALAGALEKVLTLAIGWVLLATFVPWFFFSPVVSGGAPLAGCNASCPDGNPLMIADRPSIANGFGTTEDYLAVVVAVAIVVGLCYRLMTSSAPRRRSLLPVYVPALLLAAPFAVLYADKAGPITLSSSALDRVGWFVTAGRVALSFGFLVAIWQAMVFAGVTLRTILSGTGRHEDAAHLRRLVADALDDPQLELAFEMNTGSRFFVDSNGESIDPLQVAPGRSVTELRRYDGTVAYIVHDDALETDPELVQAAGQSILLALENGRLESELRTSTGRIVAAGEAERRKLERDLHDGAQQRLVAIQIKLALLRDRLGEEEGAQLDEIADDATAAVDELRNLARGIYPTVLRERGIGDGLRAYTRTAPNRVEIVDAGVGRCAPTVEAAVYFSALEAIQNAAKHAGQGAQVRVTLERRGRDVSFRVEDDGVGFDPGGRSDGIGLLSIHDRIAAVGGILEIVSSSGAGTRVSGTVPDEAQSAR
jgi:signal transduction histidine kinase